MVKEIHKKSQLIGSRAQGVEYTDIGSLIKFMDDNNIISVNVTNLDDV